MVAVRNRHLSPRVPAVRREGVVEQRSSLVPLHRPADSGRVEEAQHVQG